MRIIALLLLLLPAWAHGTWLSEPRPPRPQGDWGYRYDDGSVEAFLGVGPRVTVANIYPSVGDFGGRFEGWIQAPDGTPVVAAAWVGETRRLAASEYTHVRGGRVLAELTPFLVGVGDGPIYLGIYVPRTLYGNRLYAFAPVDLHTPARASLVGFDGLDISRAEWLHERYPSLDGTFFLRGVSEPSTGLYGAILAGLLGLRRLPNPWTSQLFKKR